jgi:MscS family membrane protein
MKKIKYTLHNKFLIIPLFLYGLLQLILFINHQGHVQIPENIILGLRLFITIVLAFLVAGLFVKLTLSKIIRIFGNELEIEQKIFFGRLYSIFIYTLAFAFVLNRMGVSVQNLTIFLGLVTTGLAFAVRDIIISFFVWLMVLNNRPFRIGDYIRMGDDEGKVVYIGTFFVHLEKASKQTTLIPNKQFMEKSVTNLGKDIIQEFFRVNLGNTRNIEGIQKEVMEIVSKVIGSKEGVSTNLDFDNTYLLVISYPVSYSKKLQVKTKVLSELAKKKIPAIQAVP